jgi:hypothetical protein
MMFVPHRKYIYMPSRLVTRDSFTFLPNSSRSNFLHSYPLSRLAPLNEPTESHVGVKTRLFIVWVLPNSRRSNFLHSYPLSRLAPLNEPTESHVGVKTRLFIVWVLP